jgi:hypothetical protein
MAFLTLKTKIWYNKTKGGDDILTSKSVKLLSYKPFAAVIAPFVFVVKIPYLGY